MKEILELAHKIKSSNEWNLDDCRELCVEAGMEDEWDASTWETFESVVMEAAEKLGVEIL